MQKSLEEGKEREKLYNSHYNLKNKSESRGESDRPRATVQLAAVYRGTSVHIVYTAHCRV